MLKKTYSLWIMIFGLSIFCMPVSADDNKRLKGDAEAVDAIERMIERFGGKEVWSRAVILYVEYDGWRTDPDEPMIERAWRNVREPLQRSEFEGQSFYTVSVISPEASWRSRNGEVSIRTPEQHAATIDRYPFGFYNSLHTFAVADERVRLEWVASQERVIVKSADGTERSWYEIDGTGALLRWGAGLSDGRQFSYVYGPMRSFGNVNFPAWGTADDGWWRWNYVAVDVSTESEFPVSVAMPD